MTPTISRGAVIGLCLICAAGATAAGSREPPPFLDAVTMWLVANYGLVAANEVPALVAAPDADLVAMRYGAGTEVRPGEVIALYRDDLGTILVSDGWTGNTPAELSILVHEMVHHLQHAGDMRFACPAEREVLAYRAQNDWLGLFGETLETSFGIDAATLLVGTVCTH
jgi:hypothetical protein